MRIVLSLFFLWIFSNETRSEIVRIEVTVQVPFAGGKSFGAAGPYVRIGGRFHGELEPGHPANRHITDIRFAPRNARGRVEYSADFEILRPADPAKGNGTLLYDVNNRGNKRVLHLLNDTPASNDLAAPEAPGDGFLMRHGFSIAWSGWIPGLPQSPHAASLLHLHVPSVAAIEHPVWDEFLFNDPAAQQALFSDRAVRLAQLSFPAASTDKARARLTSRSRNEDAPETIPPGGWEFADSGSIRLLPPGTPFRPGVLYQFSYRAKNPPVAGIGYAATRDWIAFLRYRQQDGARNANPLAGKDGRVNVGAALAHGTSQSGRFLRDFVHQGFNETEDLRIVFDGINPHIASARLYLNHRFAQPNRLYTLGFGFLGFPEAGFPFAYDRQRDPRIGREGGLLERCRERDTCPKVLHTVSSTEYWQGGHSLVTTDGGAKDASGPALTDAVIPENVRIYHFAGTQHVITPTMPKGVCSAPPNAMVDPRPAMRALILALDRWVKAGTVPPPSIYPKLADGTLVPATALKWPAIAGFAPPKSPNPMAQFEYGARIAEGIIDTVPPVPTSFRYRVLVPAIDADGNEVAGLRMPEQAVPAATTTGWALRGAESGGAGELCYLDGMALPFAKTAAEREGAKDPRPSLAERYQDRAGFLSRIRSAAQDLARRGYYLEEDIEKTVNRAARAW